MATRAARARPAPLLLSTGPGALNSLTAVMEAASSHVPVIAVSSQIPTGLVGAGRGYLHELPDQLASFRPLVKHAVRAGSADAIPEVLARAWQVAVTPPSGPVYVEIPVDLLRGDVREPPVTALAADPPTPGGPRRRADGRRRAARRGPASGHLGRRRRAALRRAGRAARRWPSASMRPWPPPTWARARSPATIRWPPAAAATRPPSRSCSPRPTCCCASAPSSEPRPPASTSSSSPAG